jgi:dTDP-4-dehydrorhamnose 3,5-epimerase
VSYTVVTTAIPDVQIFEPRIFPDARGFFLETYNARDLAALGFSREFVQHNQSRSTKGVLRGLHYQIQHSQGKLLHVTHGAIYDVAVDIRRSSKTFGQHVGVELSDRNHRLFWVPEGFAHGFQVLSETADLSYMATDYYAPQFERSILWNDPALAIQWPLSLDPVISPKDAQGKLLREAEVFE